MSARRHVEHAPPLIFELVDERAAELTKPFVGITTDGVAWPGSATGGGPKVSTAPIIEAALAFLDGLSPSQRSQATFPMDATEWRQWFNVHMNHFRHGLMLEDLEQPQRDAALAIVRATLSARGYEQARNIMRINELVARLTGDYEAFGEWPYFVSIFGSPVAGGDEPWGWQIDGHHLCVNCVVFDDRIVTTPTFMGSEPRRIERGFLAGVSMFDMVVVGSVAVTCGTVLVPEDLLHAATSARTATNKGSVFRDMNEGQSSLSASMRSSKGGWFTSPVLGGRSQRWSMVRDRGRNGVPSASIFSRAASRPGG